MKHFYNIKGVFFDLDGTLFDTAPELIRATKKMLNELGLKTVEPDVIKSFIGKGAENLVKKSIQQSTSFKDEKLFSLGRDLFYKFYAEIADQSLAYKDVDKVMIELSQKDIKLACVTNKPKKFTNKILKKHGMDQILSYVVSGDDVRKKKPDPMPIYFACQELKINTNETIMVGDSSNDIDAGYDAGTYVVTVPYGYHYGESIDSSKVDLAVDDLTQLLNVIN